MGFTWTTINVGELVKASHLNEIYDAVNTVTSALGVATFTWQIFPTSPGQTVTWEVFDELRDAIDYAYDNNQCSTIDANDYVTVDSVDYGSDDGAADSGYDSNFDGTIDGTDRTSYYSDNDSGVDSTYNSDVDDNEHNGYNSNERGTYNTKAMRKQVACEIFSAAVCNLKCRYCYLPKTEAMHSLHRQVLERVRKGLYIEDLKKVFGKSLEYLSLWGTEPTLGLRDFRLSLPQLLNTFPKLRVFSFSSNLMTNSKEILGFVGDLARFERDLKFELQVSLDGPSWITDTNRVGGASETIVRHFLELTEGLNKIDLGRVEVEMHLKPTFTTWVVKKMNEDEEKIHEYYRFFKDLEDDFKRVNQSERVRFKNTYYGCTWILY